MNGTAQCTFQDVVTPRDYLTYMYGSTAGFMARATIDVSTRKYKDNFFFANRLIYGNRYLGKVNVYTSMNSFLSPYQKHKPGSGRKVSNLKRLNALYLDLDYYKIGLSRDQVLEDLEQNYFNKKIPVPTFIVSSGQGMYLIWKISEDRNALPRWTSVMHYLFDQCGSFKADPKALDAARVLRVPGSIHGDTGATVSVIQFNDITYSLHQLIKQYDIKPQKWDKKKSKKAVTYPYGQATERQRNVAKWQSEKLGIDLPDFSNYNETFEYIRKNSKQWSKFREEHASVYSKTSADVLSGRVNDLFKLFSMRKGDGCGREIALFLCRLWVGEQTNDFKFALEQTKALNMSFDLPHDEKYVETRTKSAETILKKGYTYRYSLSKIISILDITEAEQQELSFLRRRTVASIERRKEANRKAYLARLERENKLTKSESIRMRREQIAVFLVENKNKEEICTALNISLRTFASDKAAIISEGLLEYVKSRSIDSTNNENAAADLKTAPERPASNLDKYIEKKSKNARGSALQFFKSSNYAFGTQSVPLINILKLNDIYISEQLTWWDILPESVWGDSSDSKDSGNTS